MFIIQNKLSSFLNEYNWCTNQCVGLVWFIIKRLKSGSTHFEVTEYFRWSTYKSNFCTLINNFAELVSKFSLSITQHLECEIDQIYQNYDEVIQ